MTDVGACEFCSEQLEREFLCHSCGGCQGCCRHVSVGSTTPNRIEFFVALDPVPKGNARSISRRGRRGRPFLRSEDHVVRAEESLKVLALEFRPPQPLLGPVRLDVAFVMPIPTSAPKWWQEAARAGRVFPDKKPDRGNLLKLAEDALEGPFYVNDSQVVGGDVTKVYGDVPGYRFVLQAIEEARRPERVGRTAKEATAT